MIPLYFALTTFLIGLLAPLWFGKCLPPVRRLRQGAKWLDPQTVNTPSTTPLTVQTLREHEKCGDRIVVAHHLADWSRDLQRKIFQTLGINSAISFVLVVIFTVKGNAALQAPTASLKDLLAAVAISWPFSILLAGSLVEIAVFVKLVSDQAAKYAKVIDAARPAQKPFLERISDIFHRLIGTLRFHH